jgi:3',5'-cyclic AMP phosphodiesterase CpdA
LASSAQRLVFTVITDVYNVVFEHNDEGTAELNNSASISQMSSLAEYPDLQVANLSVSPANPFASGDTMLIGWEVMNTGNAPVVSSFHDRVRIRSAQLAHTAELLAQAPPSALRVVVLHHHLLGAPWRSRKKPVARRSDVLAALVDAGAELILAGHIHQAAVSERHEFEVVSGDIRGVTVSIAPGLGQPRPNRRGEARGLLVYECEDDALTVETYIWREDDWGLTALRRFPRGRGPLAAPPAPG